MVAPISLGSVLVLILQQIPSFEQRAAYETKCQARSIFEHWRFLNQGLVTITHT